MTLTRDGLVRALRRTLHDLADETDAGYAPRDVQADSDGSDRAAAKRMTDDDRAGR